MTRESDWDDYARSSAIALLAYEGRQCPTCGNFDTLVPLPDEPIPVRWDEHGRRVEVMPYRCLTCASSAAVRRWWLEVHEKGDPVSGQASPSDGLMLMATPGIYEEV